MTRDEIPRRQRKSSSSSSNTTTATNNNVYLLDSENLTDIMPRALYALSYLILSTAL